MKGLQDAPRPGPPKRHLGLREKVLKTLETPPPRGQAAWDGLSLAKTLGAKKSSVYALLQKHGVQLRRKRSWCVSTDSPADQENHVILDNDATHKKSDEWLKAHPNVTFHFTPTSASWLDQIEIWFGILSRKALSGASFNSTEDLAKAIDEFCEVWHENAHPFVWKKREVRGSQIRNTIVTLLE